MAPHTVIIEYHRTDNETDQMVVRNVYGGLDFAKRRCASTGATSRRAA